MTRNEGIAVAALCLAGWASAMLTGLGFGEVKERQRAEQIREIVSREMEHQYQMRGQRAP